jgi:hypothetical protein
MSKPHLHVRRPQDMDGYALSLALMAELFVSKKPARRPTYVEVKTVDDVITNPDGILHLHSGWLLHENAMEILEAAEKLGLEIEYEVLSTVADELRYVVRTSYDEFAPTHKMYGILDVVQP